MIAELKDDEILEFLMTSDFEGDYSPEELKYLLVKWRYFYRVIYGNLERTKTDGEGDVRKLKMEIESLKAQLNSSMVESADRANLIGEMKNRKLTWKERFSGKIITNEDETSRL